MREGEGYYIVLVDGYSGDYIIAEKESERDHIIAGSEGGHLD